MRTRTRRGGTRKSGRSRRYSKTQKRISSRKTAITPNIRTRVAREGRNRQNPDISQIVAVFLEILNTIKVYHWNTHSFAQHKATDELYDKLNSGVDKFVEILLGKDRVRISGLNNRAHRVDVKNTDAFKDKIHEYREFLIDMTAYFDARADSDLLSVRDEILGDVNQFLYLMTFD